MSKNNAQIPYYEQRSIGYWLMVVGLLVVGGIITSSLGLLVSSLISQ